MYYVNHYVLCKYVNSFCLRVAMHPLWPGPRRMRGRWQVRCLECGCYAWPSETALAKVCPTKALVFWMNRLLWGRTHRSRRRVFSKPWSPTGMFTIFWPDSFVFFNICIEKQSKKLYFLGFFKVVTEYCSQRCEQGKWAFNFFSRPWVFMKTHKQSHKWSIYIRTDLFISSELIVRLCYFMLAPSIYLRDICTLWEAFRMADG